MIEVKMISKLWLLICATHIVIIKGTYDPALNGIKTRNYHRTYPNAEQEPHINSQSYEPRPISNGNYGAGSVRLSPTNSYPHYDGSRTEQQPSHSHQHQHAVGQQQHQKQTAQQTASYQQRELPLFNRNAHVRHSTPKQRSERRESVLSSGLESTIPDFDTGCPPQHTGPVPYAYDCRRFVNCWHGRGHIQSCGPGTVFNPETLECDRPDKVVCGGALTNGERREQQATLHSAPQQNKYRAGRLIDASTDSVRDLCPNGFSGLAPHPNDCTKFLNCANGNTHVQNCGPGTAFSASKKVCDFKENVDCGDRENSAYGAVNNRDSRQYDEVFCPSGASGLYLHPYDCTRFLNCAHGQMVVQSCGPGTAFDRVKLICDYVQNVDCTTTIKAKSNLNYVDTNVQQNTLGRGEEKEEGDIFCPLGVSGHFPYPFDYTKFINCKNGNTAIQNCVPNTAYSISRNYCESKEKVPRTDHVAYIVSEVRYEYSLTIVSCPPSTDGLHLYPYDFTKYISCQQEHMNIVACGPKYVFSISRRECLPETQVNIADRVRNAWELRHNVESTDSRNAALNYMNELPECPQGHSSLYPYPFDCKKYLQCLDGKLSIETCDSGYVFSLSSKHCDPKDLVGNTEQVPLSFDVGQISTSESDYDYFNNNLVGIQLLCPQNVRGFFLYPFDCTKYGNTNIQSCAPNTFFSLSNKICIPSNEARDTDNLWLSTVGQVADNNFGTYHHNREWGTVDMTGAGTHTLSLEDTVQTAVCPSGASGLYPHPTDCTKYLRCANGITYVMDCGPGTAFNAALEVCDFKDKVDCSYNVDFNNVALGHDRGPSIHPITCPEGATGIYPHPLDCKKFLNCDNGITNIQDCGPGTAWNAKLETCDFIKNVDCSDTHNVHGNNPNANYQPPPTQSNYRDSTQNGWRQQHHEHGSSSQRTANDRQTYGNGVPTTSTQTGSYGDRWSNMDVQRPIASDMTYVGAYSADRQQRLPTHGRELQQHGSSNNWIASGSAIDRQTPTQSVIYEEGSLQPNRNYNTFSTYTTPLAPFKPESVPATSVNSNTFTNETTNIYYAQPVGSEENTEEVFDDSRINTQSSNRLPFNKNEFNVAQTSNKWISIPNQELLPPKRTPEPQTEAQDFPPQNIFTPASYITPPTGHAHSSTGDSSTFVPQNQFDSSNLYGGLQPPPPPPPAPTIPQSPLSHASNPIHNFEPSNPTKGGPSGRSLDEIEPIRAFSTNAHGKPHLLSPPSSMNAYKTDIDTSTPATYLQPPALPTPAAATATRSYSGASTRLKPVHNVLENTTIAMFPKDPHYSGSYSNVAHASPPKSVDFEDVQASEDLLMADALRLLLRPYFNRSGTISEENADKVEGHIMKLSPKLTSHTSVITSSTDKTIKNSPVGAENEKEVELILAGEQHSLTTVPTQNSTHETRTEFYSKNTRQESKTNSNWHNHGHSREFHRKHPNLLDPFNEDDHTSTHTHHRHNHNRAYHQRHPEIPNPFITPETPQTTTNFELSNNNLPNPHAENTTPFSVRPRIDVRGEDINCQFDCGNGNCVKSHEVCNGINNCGNRKDEEDCKHLGYEVRLTGGESLNMGRIEVKVLGKWGYVCDDKFGLSDAEVVCRELGFKLGASEVRGFSYYPPTTVDVSFAMDEVECRGNETSLKECSFKGWGVSNCGPDEVVGVVCKVPQLKCPNNYWLCSTSQECIPPAFVCDNTPDCADKSDESETVCNSPIKYRLEGGRSPNEGRLEVRYRGEWGTVCDDDFGLKEARVMCNSMGFYGTPTIVKNKYGSGNGPIWLDQVSCYGNETTLDQCGHFTWGEHNCNHTEDVGLKCTLGAPPQKENSSPQLNDFENTQRELDDTQQQLEDIGLYSEQWERKSKAVGDQRRCGQFKNNLLDEFAHPEERVVNGSIAKRGHHPWQATIRTRGRGGISSHWCGAVLISSRHLLTAAHCLAGYPKGAYLVRMGDHYANIAESSEVDSFIENWYIHEKFRDGSHMNNDIAVIVLKTPVRFNDYIQPVCLPNKGAALAENRLCTISGWGSIKSGVSTPSNILRAAELPILSDEVCKQKHVYGASLTEGMFCAGYMDESSDACDGDSGGPLICHDEDGETLYGIISWGQHCGYANKPGVYVRVEKYVDWILEKINISIQNKL